MKIIFLWIIVFFLFSCGEEKYSKLTSLQSPSKTHPLIIQMGGLFSCTSYVGLLGVDMTNNFNKLIKDLSLQVEEPFDSLRSCFGVTRKQLYFFAYKQDNNANYTKEIIKTTGDIDKQALDKFENFIIKKANKYNNRPIFIIGYSYGGWLALEMSYRLIDKVNLKGLFSLDPISLKTCTPSKYIFSFFKSVFTYWPYKGCAEQPVDLTSKYPYIKNRVYSWTNYYQTQFPLLHSNMIKEAHYNIKLSYEKIPINPGGTHILIPKDQIIWKDIKEKILAQFK